MRDLREQAFDRLAKEVKKSLDIDSILKIIKRSS
jgi:cobyric acid synthase